MSLSAYELQRLENIRSNAQALAALGIEKLTAAPPTRRLPVKGAAVNKREKRETVPPRSRSLRQRNLDVEGEPLPDKEALPEPPAPEPKRQRKSGPLEAAKVTYGKTDEDAARRFFEAAGPALAAGSVSPPISAPPASIDTVADALGAMHVSPEDVAKLVPERIFSLAMHRRAPSCLRPPATRGGASGCGTWSSRPTAATRRASSPSRRTRAPSPVSSSPSMPPRRCSRARTTGVCELSIS
jgi:hypothetical protein